ncbi:hypothetical protein LTR56_026912 [Elasticomyces elasticus]|nr:hypothetical protein LTR56_026912 [Elasticomyces elasticus]KAK3616616.1 hypothetical protein LTR22_027012 [Elasticomyces elasticus]KAK4898543.1 hypothetical protein LTR49_027797 [Elasticomyces elasticus]KAK5734195.1 hypothetical protein LTS12_026765 [Elasticomyces elasticus]
MPEQRNIVVLGASYAGLGTAHSILKHILPRLPSDGSASYKVILVNSSSKWFVRHASPRAAASEQLIPYDKIFLDIEPGFKQYGLNFEFIEGKASAWDPTERNVSIVTAGGERVEVRYHALVLATGSKTYSPLFSASSDGHEQTRAELDAIHAKLASANNIVIVGGGPTAVETAGELGEYLNGAAGWFASRPSSPKASITVITNASKLLPQLRTSIGQQAERFLNRVGVDVRYETKVSESRSESNGKTVVVLHDGEEIETDIYIPAMGIQPLSSYVPAELKNEAGYIKQNTETLRVDAAGARVYAIGDVGEASHNSIMDIIDQTPVLTTNIRRDLLAAHKDIRANADSKDRVFKVNKTETQLVPVGRNKGVGAILGYRVPSFFVWLIKGRDFMLSGAADMIDGKKWAKEAAWKGQ